MNPVSIIGGRKSMQENVAKKPKGYTCPRCDKYFRTKGGIERHSRPFAPDYRNKNNRIKCKSRD